MHMEGSSRRQSKRLKKKSFPTTSSSAPCNIETMRNPSFSDDDDFETPVPKTKSKPYTTNLRTEDGVRKEIRSKFSADNPKLTPKALSLRNEKGNRLKKRATKLKRTIIHKRGVQGSDVEEERGQLPKQAEQKKQLKKRKAKEPSQNELDNQRKKIKEKRQRQEKTKEAVQNNKERQHKKRKYKENTPEKESDNSDDDDEEEEKENGRKKQNITEAFKLRNSPANLTTMISGLSEEQKEWIRKTGFGPLLDFTLDKIPNRLAYDVLKSFDQVTQSLKLPNGTLQLTEKDVYETLGLPVGTRSFSYATTAARKNLWTSQFPESNPYNVRPQQVIDIMKGMTAADEMFKLNFMVMLSNMLLERNISSYLLRDILHYEIDLEECFQYNWGEMLINSLVKTINNWEVNRSLFFTGPIIFLTIFYVDRVTIKGAENVERQFPAFKGWTRQALKQRQAAELKAKVFGRGDIIKPRWVQNDKEQGKNVESTAEKEATVSSPTTREQEQETQHDWFDRLSIKASMLGDAIEAYKKEYESAIALMTPDDPDIIEIQLVLNQLIKTLPSTTHASNSEGAPEDGGMQPQNASNKGGNVDDVDNFGEKFDSDDVIDQNVIDQAEILEYLYSSQGRRDAEALDDEFFIPKFSLGIHDQGDPVLEVCKDINKDHGDQPNTNGDSHPSMFQTPLPQDKMPKRKTKLAAIYLSPYVQRNVDLNAKYSTEEYSTWRWIIQQGKDPLEHVFKCGVQFCIREHMMTFKAKEKLYYSLVDVWATLLNDREKYKAPESPLRIFFDTAFSNVPLNNEKDDKHQYNSFKGLMQHFFEVNPDKKIEECDLIFFPVLADEHYYLLCFNVKNKAFEVFDNIRLGKSAAKIYGKDVQLLRKHFVTYLEEKQLVLLADKIKQLKPTYPALKWQTLRNYEDCGIFLMRHMETYMGEQNTWNTGFKAEKMGQRAQLERLRVKYSNAILTSHLNEYREIVTKQAKSFYKKIANKTLMSIVLASSSKKPKNTEIHGNVLFPDIETGQEEA